MRARVGRVCWGFSASYSAPRRLLCLRERNRRKSAERGRRRARAPRQPDPAALARCGCRVGRSNPYRQRRKGPHRLHRLGSGLDTRQLGFRRRRVLLRAGWPRGGLLQPAQGRRAVRHRLDRPPHPQQFRLRVPVATIGIRGTDFSVVMCQRDCRDSDGTTAAKGLYGEVIQGRIAVTPFEDRLLEREFGAGEFFHLADERSSPRPCSCLPRFCAASRTSRRVSRSKRASRSRRGAPA